MYIYIYESSEAKVRGPLWGGERGGLPEKKWTLWRFKTSRKMGSRARREEVIFSLSLSLSLSLLPTSFFPLSRNLSGLRRKGKGKRKRRRRGGLKKKGERYFRCRSREETKTKDKILVEKNPPNKKKEYENKMK